MATVFTDVGEAKVADLWDGTVAAPADWFVGWGTGAGTAAKGDTDLFTPATEARVAAALSQPSADQNRHIATITADGTKTITNAGVFDAAGSGSPPSGGNLVVHGDHAGIGVDSGDKIEYTIDLTWS
jgi:hypothetical protein